MAALSILKTAGVRSLIGDILHTADIYIDGDRPWDIRVNDEDFFYRVFRYGSLGLGESYMDGLWDCEDLDGFICRLAPSGAERKMVYKLEPILDAVGSVVLNRCSRSRAFQVGRRHYDLGNDLFQNMLDKRMIYSCAYWKDALNLDEAQEAKLDLICRKLGLRPGLTVLDIGCGWGGLAKFAAERYGVAVVGLSVSKEQIELGRRACRDLPVELRLQDYREVRGAFDRVVSVGMFEHVGHKNYRTFFETVDRCLKENGLFLLHTIGNAQTSIRIDPWYEKYIFPNAVIPSIKQVSSALEGVFIVEDWHNLDCNYDRTLMAWFENFKRNWDRIRVNYDERFYRMWKYYLLSAAGMFRSRCKHVWQILLSKKGIPGGIQPIR